MTLNAADLDAFGQLGQALGILGPEGTPNASWFTDPLGDGSNPGLRTILTDPAQRDALLGFVDEVLGDPERETRDGAVWLPLFTETNPDVTLSAVVEPDGDVVRLGIGVEHTTAGAMPRVAISLHVPIFRFGDAPSTGTPPWLALGQVTVHGAEPAFSRADLFRFSAKWWGYLVPPVANPLVGRMAASRM